MRLGNIPFPVRVLLLGRNGSAGLPLVLTPSAPAVARGGTIAFSAAPGSGSGGLTVSPATATLTAGASRSFTAEGS